MSLRQLRTGSRVRARVNHYPAKCGAIGRILYVRHGLLYVLVEWEKPAENLGPENATELTLRDLEHFEILE